MMNKVTPNNQSKCGGMKPANPRAYFEIRGLHPGHEAVHEGTQIFALGSIFGVRQVLDDLEADGQLFLGVGRRQAEDELVESLFGHFSAPLSLLLLLLL